MELDKKKTLLFVVVFVILISLLCICWPNPKKVKVEESLVVSEFVFKPTPSAPPPAPSVPPPGPPNPLFPPAKDTDVMVGGIPTSDPFATGG